MAEPHGAVPRGSGAGVRRRIIGLAGPMALAQLLAILMPILIIAVMGWMGDEALHVRSLYMPLAFIFFAVQIAFDATNQSMTALRTGRGERDVAASTLSVGIIWLVVGLLLACVMTVLAPVFADVVGAPAEAREPFVMFLRWMSMANLTLAWPVLCASALRGTGRAGSAALIMFVGNVVEVAAMALLGLVLDLGIGALPLATALNGVITGAFGMSVLRRAGLLRRWAWLPEVLGFLRRTGLPVSMSNFMMFGMNFAFVAMLEPRGANVVSGFASASSVQNLLFMPGIVLGSAAAIVMNQQRGADERQALTPALLSALRVTLTVYCVLTPVLWLLRGQIGHLLTGNPSIAAETARYFEIVGPSYLVLGLMLTALMALEQTGGGALAVGANVFYVVGCVVAATLANHGADGPTPVYTALSAMNLAGLFGIAMAVAFMRRQDRRRGYAQSGSPQARPTWGAASQTTRQN